METEALLLPAKLCSARTLKNLWFTGKKITPRIAGVVKTRDGEAQPPLEDFTSQQPPAAFCSRDTGPPELLCTPHLWGKGCAAGGQPQWGCGRKRRAGAEAEAGLQRSGWRHFLRRRTRAGEQEWCRDEPDMSAPSVLLPAANRPEQPPHGLSAPPKDLLRFAESDYLL